VIDAVRKVNVTFLVPGVGPSVENYDLLSVNDMACWIANCAVYPQAGVSISETVQIPEGRAEAFNRLKRIRKAQAKKLGLSLRKANRNDG